MDVEDWSLQIFWSRIKMRQDQSITETASEEDNPRVLVLSSMDPSHHNNNNNQEIVVWDAEVRFDDIFQSTDNPARGFCYITPEKLLDLHN
jgi:hypothetical protein